MVRAAFLESSYRPNAVNYECYQDKNGVWWRCIGLLQVLELNVSNPDLLYDPTYNVEQSYKLWLSGGYGHWPNTAK